MSSDAPHIRRVLLTIAAAILALGLGLWLLTLAVVSDPSNPPFIGCEGAPDALLQHIETKLHPGLSLGNSSVVRSIDFDDVWLVSAEIDGIDDPGVSGSVGVWATDSLDPPTSEHESWQIVSVGWSASEHSDWSSGAEVGLPTQGSIRAPAEDAQIASGCPT